VAGKRVTIPELWARFGDTGRAVLIAGAIPLPLRRRDWNGSFDGLTGVLASSAACKAIKPFVPKRRPNGEDCDSFPSQHAAECFAAGLSLRRYFGQECGALAIGAATLVGMSRLFARKHYLFDVVAGIAIGTAATIAVEVYEAPAR
jgi:membrane-associated phospholipid phosphatase